MKKVEWGRNEARGGGGGGGRGGGRGEGEGVASPFQRPTPLVIRFSEPGKTFHGDENKPDPITQVNMILQNSLLYEIHGLPQVF